MPIKNKGFLGAAVGASALLYPFTLYFFREYFSPLYLMYGLLFLLMAQAIAPFIFSPKSPKTSLQKHTLILNSGVAGIIIALWFFQGHIAAFYYPIVMSLAMGSAFALSLLFPPSLIERLARLQDPALPPSAITYTQQVTKIWIVFCLCNALISYGTVVSGNLDLWVLYNGLMSYVLMGLLLGGEFIFRSFYKKKHHKKAFENLTSISQLYKKEATYWRAHWESEADFCQNYPSYIAALIQKINASKAKRVFLISEDRAFFLAGLLATLHTGKSLVLPPTSKPDLLKSLLKKEDVLLTDESNLGLPCIALDKITPLKTHVNMRYINPEKALIIFYTSGSSGIPKPIPKSLSQLEEEVYELQKTWPLIADQSTVLLSTVPHHHLYGLLFSLLWPISAGIPLRRTTLSHWDELQGEKLLLQNPPCPILISSPAHLKRFTDDFAYPVQRIFSSGGPLLYQHAQKSLQVFGAVPTEVYGSTETGGIAYRQQLKEKTPWTCFPTVRLSTDELSNLKVISPYVNQINQKDYFFQTADKVRLLNKAQFFLEGRSDRVVKIEGKRLSLVELENKLKNLDQVQEACTLLLASNNRHEVGAIVVLTQKGFHDLKILGRIAYIRQLRYQLSSYFDLPTLPRRWRFVQNIPENSQGKHPIALLLPLFDKKAD